MRHNNCNKSNPLSCLDHAQFPFYALAVQLSDLSFGVGAGVGVGVEVVAAVTAANSQLNFSGNQAITSCNMPCCTIAFDSASASDSGRGSHCKQQQQHQLISIALPLPQLLIASVAATILQATTTASS